MTLYLQDTERNWKLLYRELLYSTFLLLHKPDLFVQIILHVNEGVHLRTEFLTLVAMKD
jgi:hypothetical protein